MPEKIKTEDTKYTLTYAMDCIDRYYDREFGPSPSAFDNLTCIPLAYTTLTDDEIPIQVNVDLLGWKVETFLDNVLVESEQYSSLEELCKFVLEDMEFNDLIHIPDNTLQEFAEKC